MNQTTSEATQALKQGYVVQLLVLLISGIMLVYGWLNIDNDALIPIHWNIEGQVDNWTDKWNALTIGIGLIAMFPLLMWIITKIEPRRLNLIESSKVLSVTISATQILIGVVYISIILIATGKEIELPAVLVTMTGVLFVILGNYLGKIRSNFMLGIRTPWTLSSDKVWNQTHRVGGKWFMLVGLIGIITGLTMPTQDGQSSPIGLYVFFAATLLVALGLVFYSWWLYQNMGQSEK